MKKIKEVFSCPHCGKASFWFIALLGFGKKDKCFFCDKTIEVRRSFQVVKNVLNIIVFSVFYRIFMDLALYVGNKPCQPGTFALVSVTSLFFVSVMLVFISVIFYRKRDSVYERDSELNRPGETDKAAQKAAQEEREETKVKRLSFKDKRARVFFCDLCEKKMSVKFIFTSGLLKRNIECEHCAHDMRFRREFQFKRRYSGFFGAMMSNYLMTFLNTRYEIAGFGYIYVGTIAASFFLGEFLAILSVKNRDDVFMPPHDESEDDNTDSGEDNGGDN